MRRHRPETHTRTVPAEGEKFSFQDKKMQGWELNDNSFYNSNLLIFKLTLQFKGVFKL